MCVRVYTILNWVVTEKITFEKIYGSEETAAWEEKVFQAEAMLSAKVRRAEKGRRDQSCNRVR